MVRLSVREMLTVPKRFLDNVWYYRRIHFSIGPGSLNWGMMNVANSVAQRNLSWLAIFCAGLFVLVSAAWGDEMTPDYEREQRLIEEAEAGLFDGEIVYLSTQERDVFAILSQPDEQTLDGAVILLHGRGFHPDWPQVAGPLREGLTERGVSTLAVQMPVLAKDAKYYDYLQIIPESFPRIEAAINYLHSAGYEWIAMVAHSCSVHMTMAWVKQFGNQGIDAYIGIGMGATDFRQPMLAPFPIERLRIPLLDLFGSQDYQAVIQAAPDRLAAIERAGNPKSAQIMIDGADHFFEDYEDELVQVVSQWLMSARN